MPETRQNNDHLMIAIPLSGGELSRFLGTCDELAIFEIDTRRKHVLYESVHKAPPHEWGLLPSRLHQLGVDVILAGEMGRLAQELLKQKGIGIVMNVPPKTPATIISDFLGGKLATGDFVRDH